MCLNHNRTVRTLQPQEVRRRIKGQKRNPTNLREQRLQERLQQHQRRQQTQQPKQRLIILRQPTQRL